MDSKQFIAASDIEDTVMCDRGGVNRASHISFKEYLLLFFGGEDDELTVFITDIDFAVSHEG